MKTYDACVATIQWTGGISSLLKKRQNRNLTDADRVRLQELIDTRNAILVKYRLVPEDSDSTGFETIHKKVEGEVARVAARGHEVCSRCFLRWFMVFSILE